MGEFFKGWRRKAGLVTLAVALVLMVAWNRSYAIVDQVWIEDAGDQAFHTVVSLQGRLGWVRTIAPRRSMRMDWDSEDLAEFADTDFYDEWSKELYAIERRIEWAGFRFGAALETPLFHLKPMVCAFIPYWALILPLTLLSAWLLLTKPRKAKSQ